MLENLEIIAAKEVAAPEAYLAEVARRTDENEARSARTTRYLRPTALEVRANQPLFHAWRP